MAGINLSSLMLYDGFPGVPTLFNSVPSGGWDNTIDNFKTTDSTQKYQLRYPVGTKIVGTTDNSWCPGNYTMAYLMYHSYESGALYDVSKDFSDGYFWCSKADGSTAEMYSSQGDTSTIPWYVVSKCITKAGGDVSMISAVAVPCATLSSDGTGVYVAGYGDSFGWFWVGGVCPAKEVTIMDNTGAGIGSTCAGIGACVTGTFVTGAKGKFYMEYSTALGSPQITCDLTSVGDVTDLFNTGVPTPLGWICMTAI